MENSLNVPEYVNTYDQNQRELSLLSGGELLIRESSLEQLGGSPWT